MRILQVIHDFLPQHRAGSEIYTYQLGKALRRRGHDVLLLCTEHRPDRRQYTVRQGHFEDLPLVEVVWNGRIRSFSETYRNPRMDRIFAGVVDAFRPDVVHLQHLEHFSLGLIDESKRRGLPVVFTLHEYCLTCPRHGVRMMADLTLCETLDAGRCATCLAGRPGIEPMSPMERLRFAIEGAVPPRLLAAWKRRQRRGAPAAADTAPTGSAEPMAPERRALYERAVTERWAAVRAACAAVDLFIAPSPFLRSVFIDFGIDPGRIVASDNGLDFGALHGLERTTSDRVRFVYTGTLADYKGVHLAVTAMNRMPEGRATLSIWGNPDVFPDYARGLRELARHPDISFEGPFDNRTGLAAVLREADVQIVPSLWFENSPLTIHEAFAAGIPVIATDLGGMKDLVTPGRSGLLFRRGDDEDLFRAMKRFLDQKELLGTLRRGLPKLKTDAEDAADMERRYEQLLAARGKEGVVMKTRPRPTLVPSRKEERPRP